jgi:disulfide bond formation protein DsbB
MAAAFARLKTISPVYAGGGALLVALATILTARAFESIGGYIPCPLCLQQRYAYYVGIPLLASGLALLYVRKHTIAAVLFAAVAVGFLANAGLGVYQAGAEWQLWDPPATCAAPSDLPTLTLDAKGLNRQPVSCGVASWRMFGLSFAGWNVLASLALAGGAATAAAGAGHLRHASPAGYRPA